MEVLSILGQSMTMSGNIWYSCLTKANISYKNCFQYADVPLTEFINTNANSKSLAINRSIIPLKLLLTVLAVGVPGLFLCIAKFIKECGVAYTETCQKTYNLHLK